MPTYEYACKACGEPHEAVQSFHDAPLTECPHCGGELRKVFSSVGVVFKGSGFYRTDSRSSGTSTETGAKGSGSTDKDSASKGSTSSDSTSSDSKSRENTSKESGSKDTPPKSTPKSDAKPAASKGSDSAA